MNLSILLFLIGILGFVLNRKNIILMLISIQIMLLGITLSLLVHSFIFDDILGQVFSIYIIALVGVESTIGLGILVAFYRLRGSTNIENRLMYVISFVSEIRPVDISLKFIVRWVLIVINVFNRLGNTSRIVITRCHLLLISVFNRLFNRLGIIIAWYRSKFINLSISTFICYINRLIINSYYSIEVLHDCNHPASIFFYHISCALTAYITSFDIEFGSGNNLVDLLKTKWLNPYQRQAVLHFCDRNLESVSSASNSSGISQVRSGRSLTRPLPVLEPPVNLDNTVTSLTRQGNIGLRERSLPRRSPVLPPINIEPTVNQDNTVTSLTSLANIGLRERFLPRRSPVLPPISLEPPVNQDNTVTSLTRQANIGLRENSSSSAIFSIPLSETRVFTQPSSNQVLQDNSIQSPRFSHNDVTTPISIVQEHNDVQSQNDVTTSTSRVQQRNQSQSLNYSNNVGRSLNIESFSDISLVSQQFKLMQQHLKSNFSNGHIEGVKAIITVSNVNNESILLRLGDADRQALVSSSNNPRFPLNISTSDIPRIEFSNLCLQFFPSREFKDFPVLKVPTVVNGSTYNPFVISNTPTLKITRSVIFSFNGEIPIGFQDPPLQRRREIHTFITSFADKFGVFRNDRSHRNFLVFFNGVKDVYGWEACKGLSVELAACIRRDSELFNQHTRNGENPLQWQRINITNNKVKYLLDN